MLQLQFVAALGLFHVSQLTHAVLLVVGVADEGRLAKELDLVFVLDVLLSQLSQLQL